MESRERLRWTEPGNLGRATRLSCALKTMILSQQRYTLSARIRKEEGQRVERRRKASLWLANFVLVVWVIRCFRFSHVIMAHDLFTNVYLRYHSFYISDRKATLCTIPWFCSNFFQQISAVCPPLFAKSKTLVKLWELAVHFSVEQRFVLSRHRVCAGL